MTTTLKLKSTDGIVFPVSQPVAKRIGLIQTMLQDVELGESEEIELPNVESKILEKVLYWVDHHKDDPPLLEEDEEERKRTDNICYWDRKFMEVDQKTLFDLLLAANYLNIGPLISLGCKTVANMMKGKTAEQIRATFNIQDDTRANASGAAAAAAGVSGGSSAGDGPKAEDSNPKAE